VAAAPTPVTSLTQRSPSVELSGVFILFAVSQLFCDQGVVQPVPNAALNVLVLLLILKLTTPKVVLPVKYFVLSLCPALVSVLPIFGIRISNTKELRPLFVIND